MTFRHALNRARIVRMYLTPANAGGVAFRVSKFSVTDAVDDLDVYDDEDYASWTYDKEDRTLNIHWAT